ncbi:hypothetical protein O9993_08830 [Vibrio lentus]|nr:hypothetical protein [Vibrio lentus]
MERKRGLNHGTMLSLFGFNLVVSKSTAKKVTSESGAFAAQEEAGYKVFKRSSRARSSF